MFLTASLGLSSLQVLRRHCQAPCHQRPGHERLPRRAVAPALRRVQHAECAQRDLLLRQQVQRGGGCPVGRARGDAMCSVGKEPHFCVAVGPAAIPLAASPQSSFLLPRPQGSTDIACTALSLSVLVMHKEMRVLAMPAVYFLGGVRAKVLWEQLDSSALACAPS